MRTNTVGAFQREKTGLMLVVENPIGKPCPAGRHCVHGATSTPHVCCNCAIVFQPANGSDIVTHWLRVRGVQ